MRVLREGISVPNHKQLSNKVWQLKEKVSYTVKAWIGNQLQNELNVRSFLMGFLHGRTGVIKVL